MIEKIQILGPFNTGTNLLSKILKKNVDQIIEIHPEGHTLFWKHTIRKDIIQEHIDSNNDTLFICLYKPLHYWLCSMLKESYCLNWNKKIESKILNFRGLKFTNIIDVYNTYYNGYMELINNNDRVIFMDYYEIINDSTVEEYITNKLSPFNLSLRINNDILLILNKPAKGHGNSVESSEMAKEKKNYCYNKINSCKKNRAIIKKYYNYEITKYFESDDEQ